MKRKSEKSNALVLVLNCGGSSLKYKLFTMPGATVSAAGKIEDIGCPQSLVRHQAAGTEPVVRQATIRNHQESLQIIIDYLETLKQNGIIGVSTDFLIVHKIAHGGPRVNGVELIDARIEAAIAEMAAVVAVHNPPMLQGIRAMRAVAPAWPQIAVFETGFHETVPRYARVYGLPLELAERYGLWKYGFHGASHQYISQTVPRLLECDPQGLRLISIHLGSGTSVAAIKGGVSLDISSGFTPQSGTLMSTRAGDFDPEVLFYLLAKEKMTLAEIRELLNHQAGLAGISGLAGGDLRQVEGAAAAGNDRAQLALDAFCYGIRKYIGAFGAVLQGIDALAFTGGIGENNPRLREMICRDMEWLGIRLDPDKNAANPKTGLISAADSPVRIVVLPTDEELIVAQRAFEFWAESAAAHELP